MELQRVFAKPNLDLCSTLSDLATIRAFDDLGPLLRRFARDYGFDNSGFACLNASTDLRRPGNFIGLLDFPSSWTRRYNNLSQMPTSLSDPVIRHVSTFYMPTTWDCRGRIAFTKPSIAHSARKLLGIAGENGLRAGMTIPLWGRRVAWSYVVLTCRDVTDSRELLPSLSHAALFAQGFMATVQRLTAPAPSAELTDNQREVLRWCTVGKTSWEISLILGVSEATVNFHLKNIARKFNVRGRAACVGHALANQLIAI